VHSCNNYNISVAIARADTTVTLLQLLQQPSPKCPNCNR
jgi:hypothetical protein